MTARARSTLTPILVLLAAAILAYGISCIPTLGVAHADGSAAIDPPPDAARADAPAIAADLPRETTVDDVAAPWRRGEYLAGGIALVALLLGVALRVDPRRAMYYTAGLVALGGCIELVHAGATPNTSMLVGAAAAFVLWLMRSPAPPPAARPRDPQRGSISTPLVWLLSLTIIIGGGLIWSCASTRGAARQVASDVVYCAAIIGHRDAATYGLRIEASILAHTSPSGDVDWSAVGRDLAVIVGEVGVEVAGCAAERAIARLLAPAADVAAGPAPSAEELAEGRERLRVEQLGGRRYLPEVATP